MSINNGNEQIFIKGREVASKKYVNDLVTASIAGVAQFSLLPVDALPTEDIKTNVIYAVPSKDPKEKDVRIEYVYINNDWEIIGTTKIDLSNYYTKAEVDEAILATGFSTESYYSKADVDALLAEMQASINATRDEINSELETIIHGGE